MILIDVVTRQHRYEPCLVLYFAISRLLVIDCLLAPTTKSFCFVSSHFQALVRLWRVILGLNELSDHIRTTQNPLTLKNVTTIG